MYSVQDCVSVLNPKGGECVPVGNGFSPSISEYIPSDGQSSSSFKHNFGNLELYKSGVYPYKPLLFQPKLSTTEPNYQGLIYAHEFLVS